MGQLASDDLRDRAEILDLIHRFVLEADKRNAEGMVDCVTRDAIVSFNDGELLLEGAAALRTFMAGQFSENGTLNPRTAGTHAMCNSIIKVDGDRATAETSGVTYLATPANIVHMRGVRYVDAFVKLGGRWLLADRRHSCGWQADVPGYTAPKLLT